MKIENLKCHDYKVVGDTLTAIVVASGMEEIKTALFGKETLSIYTDNTENLEVSEELIGFENGKSILADLENGQFTVTITRKSDMEKRLERLEQILIPSEDENTAEKVAFSVRKGNITGVIN